MIGGGTAYDVYWRTADKPSRPLHGFTYATVICHEDGEYYRTADAIDPKARWSMDQGLEKWKTSKALEKVAARLAVRVAKRAFPELRGRRQLPGLWAGWTLPSAEIEVAVKLQLPE